MGLLKAPQVQMLRDAGRSMRTDVSSALRPVDPDRKQIQNKSIVFYISNESKGVEPALAEQLKIIPLGGLNEIGKNMTVYEYGGEIIVVDCGMAFPGDDMYGIDCVIPDVSYLVKHKNRIRGMFITHGHEDHIGAVPYILKKVNIPIYCTRLTAGLIRLKLEEHGLLKTTKIVTVESGMTVKAGKFSVEFIHVNHSILVPVGDEHAADAHGARHRRPHGRLQDRLNAHRRRGDRPCPLRRAWQAGRSRAARGFNER